MAPPFRTPVVTDQRRSSFFVHIKNRGWTSGRLSEADNYESHHGDKVPHVGKPSITKGMLREWATMTYNETGGMRYVLESTERGHCTKNAECHCFPPYRGPLCEYEDPARGPKKPYRALIHYLTSNDEVDVRDMTRSLSRLWKRYNNLHDYPVLIFHDGLDAPNRRRMVDASGNRLWFSFVDDFKELPNTVKNVAEHVHQLDDLKWSIGYRGNCRFRAGPVFLQPVMKHYDYAMTLDSDSYFPAELTLDPLEGFHKANATYSFAYTLRDQPATLRHLWSYTLAYMAMKGIHPLGTANLQNFVTKELRWHSIVFMGDVEIVSLAYFGDPRSAYHDYFRFLDSLNGFWLYRWGNNAVRTLGVAMFVPESQVYEFDIPYAHQAYCQCTVTSACVLEGRNGTSRWPGEQGYKPWRTCAPS